MEQAQLQSDLSKISDNYDTLLAGQKATHGEIYDRVLLDLGRLGYGAREG